jgi:Kelch motif
VRLGIAAAFTALGAVIAWLLVAQPRPREAAGWSLGPSLPPARGELATVVGYARPCPVPPCPQTERLYVLGGLAGLFRPLASVSVYDPDQQRWIAGPALPAARHHLAAARLGDAT